MKDLSAADIEGPWVDPDFESGLIQRCRENWSVPFSQVSDQVLATFMRQDGVLPRSQPYLITVAEQRLEKGQPDETELYDGELANALHEAQQRSKRL